MLYLTKIQDNNNPTIMMIIKNLEIKSFFYKSSPYHVDKTMLNIITYIVSDTCKTVTLQ